jgi:glycosyltransferase involved in cell wall biosynthesis
VNRLRILAIAHGANPESISISLISYLHANALAQLHSVTLVTRANNEAALRRAKSNLASIETISMPWLDRIWEWTFQHLLKSNFHSRFYTPMSMPVLGYAFEWTAWRRLRNRIKNGDFDVVLRISPVNSILPSIFPFFLRNHSTPFVIGPLNGGLPWPRAFSQASKQKSWIDKLRSAYKFLPFSRSTYSGAAAILAASSQTCAEFSEHRDKIFFVPENGISSSLCSETVRTTHPGNKIQLIFVGGLVPYKACDLALRAAAPFLREGLANFTVVGDGPERSKLEQLVKSLQIESAVTFRGMLTHAETIQHLSVSDILVFPSVREFGGGVVFEALAVGAVPLVADFGGPGDTVNPEIGRKVTLTNEKDVVSQLEQALAELIHDRDLLERLRRQGMAYARRTLTWEAKARTVTEILNWVLSRGPKPHLPPPKALVTGDAGA